MFNKVIIAEDLDSINIAVVQALESLSIPEIQYAKYCDEAFLKIKKALAENQPFELLITDLSFKIDHRDYKLSTGEELIKEAKKLNPEIKIIAFSIEDKSYRIKSLFENLGINGYVIKGRNSIPELKKAVQWIFNEEKFLSPELNHILKDKTINEIDNYDLQLIKYLSIGIQQDDMEIKFKELGITPNSKSAIEKRINKLKIYFKANNTVHLIALAKDLGIA